MSNLLDLFMAEDTSEVFKDVTAWELEWVWLTDVFSSTIWADLNIYPFI